MENIKCKKSNIRKEQINLYYSMIFKRKSFHVFKGKEQLKAYEILELSEYIKNVKPLISEIETTIRIVRKEETSCKRGEYCILFYSEVKENYLQNIGYMGEQIDLWLASKNIGTCWYGVGKINEDNYNGQSFVIMMAIGKVREGDFRKDYRKIRRKAVEEFWIGDKIDFVSEVVKYAPSACNTQPWLVKSENKNVYVFRVKGRRGIMPKDKVSYYNQIDIGIFLFFMEICLRYIGVEYYLELVNDNDEGNEVLNGVFRLV